MSCKVQNPLYLFSLASSLEDTFIKYQEDYPKAYPASVVDLDMMSPQACHGCGGDHRRKDCPHMRDRCAHCSKIGHTSAACRNKVTHDTAGRQRVVTQPKQRGITSEVLLDNTTPDQFRTVAGVVDKLISTTAQSNERARERYAEKRRQEDPLYQKREQPARDVLMTTQKSTMSTSRWRMKKKTMQVNEKSIWLSLMTTSISSPSPRKLSY